MKKRISKSMNMYVIFGLLAVLFISLGYLSMQTGREGFVEGNEEKKEEDDDKKKTSINISLNGTSTATPTVGTSPLTSISTQGFKVREGLADKMLTPPKKDDKKEGFFGFNMN